MFISEAFAQAGDAAAAQGSVYGTLIQLGLIFVIFYVLLIRPQQKKIKQHEAMLMAIKKGDKVQLVGFGSFEVKNKPERKGKNPRTGEAITIKASKAPVFKAGQAFKDYIA